MENLDSEDLDQNSNVDNSINNGKNQVNFLSFVPRAIFVYAFVAACLISVTAKLLIMYNLQFGDELSDSNGDWGTFGDYLGGVLNPILGFASFMALLYTVRLQSNELKNITGIENYNKYWFWVQDVKLFGHVVFGYTINIKEGSFAIWISSNYVL